MMLAKLEGAKERSRSKIYEGSTVGGLRKQFLMVVIAAVCLALSAYYSLVIIPSRSRSQRKVCGYRSLSSMVCQPAGIQPAC